MEYEPDNRPPYEPLPEMPDGADAATRAAEAAWRAYWSGGQLRSAGRNARPPLIRASRTGVLLPRVVELARIARAAAWELPLVPPSRYN